MNGISKANKISIDSIEIISDSTNYCISTQEEQSSFKKKLKIIHKLSLIMKNNLSVILKLIKFKCRVLLQHTDTAFENRADFSNM